MHLSDIFPQSEHMKVVMFACVVLGEWPFISENHPILKRLYNLYALTIFTYFVGYTLSALVKFFILLNGEIIIVEEVMANLTVTLYYGVTAIRATVIKNIKEKTFIRPIINWEGTILESTDEAIIRIYKSCIRRYKLCNVIFICSLDAVAILHFVCPLFFENTVLFYESRNETVVKRPLPLISWFPFDEQEHYVTAYLMQILNGTIGTGYVGYTDVLTHSVIMFPVSQIKILRHVMANFEKYVTRVAKQIRCGQEEASFITMRECILKHKQIISYIREFNKTMRTIMLLDFLQSSMHLASVSLGLMVVHHMNIFNIMLTLVFALSMLIRLLMYYWYANEILVQSADFPRAINESKWYEQPLEVQRMMLLMMMRCNRALNLEIGTFTTMTLATFLAVLKATYSYIMIVYQ